MQYTGERIGVKEGFRRAAKFRRAGNPGRNYLFCLNSRWLLDGAVGGSGAEYVNHSCDPNVIALATRTRILFFSRKRIKEGEELTLDYRICEGTYSFPCHCGSRRCRGTMELK